jgi:hypothetical protein
MSESSGLRSGTPDLAPEVLAINAVARRTARCSRPPSDIAIRSRRGRLAARLRIPQMRAPPDGPRHACFGRPGGPGFGGQATLAPGGGCGSTAVRFGRSRASSEADDSSGLTRCEMRPLHRTRHRATAASPGKPSHVSAGAVQDGPGTGCRAAWRSTNWRRGSAAACPARHRVPNRQAGRGGSQAAWSTRRDAAGGHNDARNAHGNAGEAS